MGDDWSNTDYYFKDIDQAINDLNYLMGSISDAMNRRNPRERGFDNKRVLKIVKGWDKVVLRAGLGGGAGTSYLWWERRVPERLQPNQKRSQVMLTALYPFREALKDEHKKIKDTDAVSFYYTADTAILNFVWDYHEQIVDDANKNTQFVAEIKKYMGKNAGERMKEHVFPQHIKLQPGQIVAAVPD